MNALKELTDKLIYIGKLPYDIKAVKINVTTKDGSVINVQDIINLKYLDVEYDNYDALILFNDNTSLERYAHNRHKKWVYNSNIVTLDDTQL